MASFLTPAIEPDEYVPYRALRRWQKVDMDLLDVREGHSILDVGCGEGYLLSKAARRASPALGVDLDESRLRASRDGLSDSCRPGQSPIEFAVADGQRLPFADASFDRIICTETLEHVADAELTLRELARVLRPGGRLAISVPHFLCEAILYRLIRGYLEFPGAHRRIFTPRTLTRALARADLQPYAGYLRDSLEATYWILLSLLSRPPRRFDGVLAALERWRARTRAEPYSRLYHAADQLGNRLLPKSVVVYALKPACPARLSDRQTGRQADRQTGRQARQVAPAVTPPEGGGMTGLLIPQPYGHQQNNFTASIFVGRGLETPTHSRGSEDPRLQTRTNDTLFRQRPLGWGPC